MSAVRVTGPRPREGQLWSDGDTFVLPDAVMVLTWQRDPMSLWDSINGKLDTHIDEYESERLSSNQAMAAAAIFRQFAAATPADVKATMTAAAEFLEAQAAAGRSVEVIL